MKQVVQKLRQHEALVAVFFVFLTAVVTYGTRIPTLGYYYDDWYLLWSGLARGAGSIIPLFSTDRPYMGVVYSYVYRLLGDQLINWQLYALLWRFLGGLAFLWILRLLWPQQKYLTTMMTVLFIVYPGFLSLPNANTRQNHLFGFASALLSIALMLQALKTRAVGWKVALIALSALLTANYLFIYEYMLGFEGARLALLGYALFQDGFRKWRSLAVEALKHWWPYPIVTAAFLYWRIFIFDSSRHATNATRLVGDYLGNLRYMSMRLTFETAKDFLDTSIFAWFVQPYHLISSAEYSNLGKALLIAAVILLLAWLYSFAFKQWGEHEYQEETLPGLSRDFLWLGAFVTLCAVFPVVLSGRNVDLTDAYKSYGLHPISGVVIFVAGIALMFRPHIRKAALLTLLVISVTTQGLNADRWKRFWKYERETWWQLSWRAPDIQNDTLVMAYFPNGYQLQQDYETWGPVNLIYRPGPAEAPAIQAEVLTSQTSYDILRKSTRANDVRDIPMNRNFNNLLLISLPSDNSCAHLLDGSLPVYSESDSLLIQRVGGYSHIDRIVTSGEAHLPPTAIFGAEPAHGWCYYYQKAALARQEGNWKEVGRLYDEIIAKNLRPGDQSEWVPYIEGLVNQGRAEEAKALVNKEIKGREGLRYPLCSSLSKDPGYPPNFGYDYPNMRMILCD
jgi:hypothetical protein